MSPVSSEPETRREALLAVASELFYQQGFHATGIKQIIEVAGIAKGTFYSHFKSKEEIGAAWLRKRHEQWNRMLEDHLRKLSGTPRQQLLGLFDFLKLWMEACAYRGCAFLNVLGELPDDSHPMRREIEYHKRSIHERIRQLVDAHFVKATEDRRDVMAAAIFVSFEGAIVTAQNFRDPWPIVAGRAQLESVL